MCDRCGQLLQLGDWPFCPHGQSQVSVHTDDVPGGFVAENGFAQPRRFYSKSEHARALAAENCEVRAYWVPGDQHLTRWDSVDLDAAKQLCMPRTKHTTDAVITVSVGEAFREKDLV